MKEVTRYKCDFCIKVFAMPETVERHEKECLKNPDGVNCFLCEQCNYGAGLATYEEITCDWHEEPLYILKLQAPCHKSFAPICSEFKRRKENTL